MLYQAACMESNAASYKEDAAKEQLRPFMLLRPKILKDGIDILPGMNAGEEVKFIRQVLPHLRIF